ncbi:MAG: NAD(P)-binding protein [Gammaproteobacteria bacterium]|nr:NAD(P)-binding protein [Gammaproteobacteria bacterium]
MKKKIAVLGGGLSGLTVAKKQDGVFDVTVFEKFSGVGGRLATRAANPILISNVAFGHPIGFTYTQRIKEIL